MQYHIFAHSFSKKLATRSMPWFLSLLFLSVLTLSHKHRNICCTHVRMAQGKFVNRGSPKTCWKTNPAWYNCHAPSWPNLKNYIKFSKVRLEEMWGQKVRYLLVHIIYKVNPSVVFNFFLVNKYTMKCSRMTNHYLNVVLFILTSFKMQVLLEYIHLQQQNFTPKKAANEWGGI